MLNPRNPDSRRQFLQRLVTLCVAVAAAPAGAAAAPPRNAALMTAKAAAQWARIERGLDAKTMAACRKAAASLVPRLTALLQQRDWEAKTLKAVADELKKLGAYPDRAPAFDAACAKEEEADRLRAEAASRKPTSNSISAALAVANAVVATLPAVGPIIAAVLIVIAAVIMLLAQAQAQADRESAKRRPASEHLLKLQDALVLKLEPVRDCHCFGKKVSG